MWLHAAMELFRAWMEAIWLRGRNMIPARSWLEVYVSTQTPFGAMILLYFQGPFAIGHLSPDSGGQLRIAQRPNSKNQNPRQGSVVVPFRETVARHLLAWHPTKKAVALLILKRLAKDGNVHDQLAIRRRHLRHDHIECHLRIEHHDVLPPTGAHLPCLEVEAQEHDLG